VLPATAKEEDYDNDELAVYMMAKFVLAACITSLQDGVL